MTHVGIQGLGPGHGQEDAAQDDEAEKAVIDQKQHAVVRRQGPEDRGVVENVPDAETGEDQEPDQGQRPEIPRHAGGAA